MPHLLKRLELNGFKSFAGRTVFEFPAGITAIVGPNGSGKSNIVDAVRWLLGEREAKNLRGVRVDDLIFAGTPKKPRLGQARASLHFDNGHGFFPVDFSEVAVTREVRRDGTSRYFLNKSEILLRDLIDFFAKARLGSRGLIVVTQGNSDIFMRVSPRERREMMEEILGLREYQLKKTDAERRLKNSQINLDKAKALTEEILPHLRSLKRQTNKWAKRGELEDELKELENSFFSHHFSEIKTKMSGLEKSLEVKRQELQALEKEKRAAEETQKRLELSQPEERKEILKIRGIIQNLSQRRGALDKELGRLEVKMEVEATKPAAAAHNTADLLHLLKNVRNVLRGALGKPPAELAIAVRSALENIEKLLETGTGQKDMPADVKVQLEKINKDIADIQKEIETLRLEEGRLEKNQESFYESFKKAVAAVEAAKDRIEKWHAGNQELAFKKERLLMRREELTRQVVGLGRKPEEFKEIGPARASVEELAQMERRMFKLRGDLAAIGEIDEALVKEAREAEDRYGFLTKESKDLVRAIADLKKLIAELDEKVKTEFSKALVKINEEFSKFFGLMFGGGHAKLKVEKLKVGSEKLEEIKEESPEATAVSETEPAKVGEDEEIEGGIDIDVKLPRKKINTLEALSGGERSLVGIATLFALISVSPPPFLVLDEIDAALDDRNARRFADLLKEFSKKTQFIVVTHNRATMEAADVLYGVTLNDDGTSKVLSLKLE